jgi:hypothetical protein
MDYSWGYGNWRITPYYAGKTSNAYFTGTTKSYNFTLNRSKLLVGSNTVMVDMSRITDTTWWNALPATNAIKVFHINDGIYLPHTDTRYINKTRKNGKIWITFSNYADVNPSFEIMTGPTMTDTTNSSMAANAGWFSNIWPLCDTSGTVPFDVGGGLVGTASDITWTTQGAHFTTSLSGITLPIMARMSTGVWGGQAVCSWNILDSTTYSGSTVVYFNSVVNGTTYLQLGVTGTTVYLSNLFDNINGTNITFPLSLWVKSKWHNLVYFFNVASSQILIDSRDRLFLDNVEITSQCSFTAYRNNSAIAGFSVASTLGRPAGLAAICYQKDFMCGNTLDSSSVPKMASAIYYSTMHPESLVVSESNTTVSASDRRIKNGNIIGIGIGTGFGGMGRRR